MRDFYKAGDECLDSIQCKQSLAMQASISFPTSFVFLGVRNLDFPCLNTSSQPFNLFITCLILLTLLIQILFLSSSPRTEYRIVSFTHDVLNIFHLAYVWPSPLNAAGFFISLEKGIKSLRLFLWVLTWIDLAKYVSNTV
jgi:hypothetical protein